MTPGSYSILNVVTWETGDHTAAEELQIFGLDTRARAHAVLEREMSVLQEATQKQMDVCIKEGEDIVDTFLKVSSVVVI